MSSAGRAASSSGCVARPRGRETGLTGYAEPIQRSLPTGSSAMETAEHREPYEPRGSRTDLGAPGGKSSGRLDRTSKAQNELTFSGLLPTAELRLGARGYVGACLIEVSYERYFTFPIG